MSEPEKEINWQAIYKNPDYLSEFEFATNSQTTTTIFIEPNGLSFVLKPNREFKIVSHDQNFRFEIHSESEITFWLQHSFGCQVFERQANGEWKLETDYSEVQFGVK